MLVDEVGDELGDGDGVGLVVGLEGALEADDEAAEDELADLGELAVDDGDEGGVDVAEGGGEGLGLDDGAGEEALAPDEVLLEEGEDGVVQVPHVHLVHMPVDLLLQPLPLQPLVLLTATSPFSDSLEGRRCGEPGFVLDLGLHALEDGGRDVGAARPRLGGVHGGLGALLPEPVRRLVPAAAARSAALLRLPRLLPRLPRLPWLPPLPLPPLLRPAPLLAGLLSPGELAASRSRSTPTPAPAPVPATLLDLRGAGAAAGGGAAAAGVLFPLRPLRRALRAVLVRGSLLGGRGRLLLLRLLLLLRTRPAAAPRGGGAGGVVASARHS